MFKQKFMGFTSDYIITAINLLTVWNISIRITEDVFAGIYIENAAFMNETPKL